MFVAKLLAEHAHGTLLLVTERRVLEFTVDTCHDQHVGFFTSKDASQMAYELRLSYGESTASLQDETVSGLFLYAALPYNIYNQTLLP